MINYITLESAISIHSKTLEHSGGGINQIINEGQLDAILEFVQNDDYYPSFIDKTTYLFFSLCKDHCFADGNKRIAITITAQFLIINGYMNIAGEFFREMEAISYNVAAGKIDRALLHKIITAFIERNYTSNESLKLEIFNAINQNTD